MTSVTVKLSIAGNKAVQLEPDTIYRIGRKSGLEFYTSDESVELAHGTITLKDDAAVRLVAVGGRIWVNEQEQSFVDLTAQDSCNAYIKLRFGNVEAKLEIAEADGNGEEKQDTRNIPQSVPVPIPETQDIPHFNKFSTPMKWCLDHAFKVPGKNPTFSTESCCIPETQDNPNFSFSSSISSLGDDFFVPETQDAEQLEEGNQIGDHQDSVEVVTPLRMNMQDFNAGSAVKDFHSSSSDSANHHSLAGKANSKIADINFNKFNCALDLFDLDAAGGAEGGVRSPDLFEPQSASQTIDFHAQQVNGAKQLVAKNQDHAETQEFSLKKDREIIQNLSKPDGTDHVNQDCIETQVVPIREIQRSWGHSLKRAINSKDDSGIPAKRIKLEEPEQATSTKMKQSELMSKVDTAIRIESSQDKAAEERNAERINRNGSNIHQQEIGKPINQKVEKAETSRVIKEFTSPDVDKGRTRFAADPLQSINRYLRSIKSMGKIKIALSMCNVPALQGVLRSLMNLVEVTPDPRVCDVLIMEVVDCTYKFLIAIAANKPILSSKWLYSLRESRSIVVESNHLISDPKFEKLYKFNPRLVMEYPKILNSINFMLSEGIQPNELEMKAIIETAGGKVHTRPPKVTQERPLYMVTTTKGAEESRRLLSNLDNVKFIRTEGVMQVLIMHNLKLLNDFQVNSSV